MKISGPRILAFIVLLTVTCQFSAAQLRLPALFSDNMVLQHNMELPVWGWAEPKAKITIEIGGSVVETTADREGNWKAFVGPLPAGGPYEMLVSGNTSIRIRNILAGEVWICSGQSNMAMEVKSCQDAEEEISSATYPGIRHFQVKRSKAESPRAEVESVSNPQLSWLNTWEICDPSTVGHFSGTAYFFARKIHADRKIPIGIIHTSWGGTTAEAWTPADRLESDPELRDILSEWPAYNNDEDWLTKQYEEFSAEVEKARSQGKPEPLYFNQPSVLFNGMIAPLIPFAIRGVIWYQGESNAYRASQYQKLFPALISSWRKSWGQGKLPFLFVQLANYHFEPQVFPELRDAQSSALKLPHTAMAVAIDIGDSSDIHPGNKQEVGRRLALAALKTAYGEDLEYSGPVYKQMLIEGNRCRLSFEHVAEGLVAKGNKSLEGFTIAGKDRIFKDAMAIIDGDQVLVWNEETEHPVAVRYAWANHPSGCNLYNRVEKLSYLPASPFRTDNWPDLSQTYSDAAIKERLHSMPLYNGQSDVLNGSQWTYSKIYKGNPFLEESYWPAASLSYRGELYEGYQVNYDLYKDELILLYETEKQTKYIVLIKDYFDSLSYTDSLTLKSHTYIYSRLPGTKEKALYEKVYEGRSSFVLRPRCMISSDPSGTFAGTYQRSYEYYISTQGGYERVNSKKALLNALGTNIQEVKKFMRKNRLSFNNKEPETIVPILKYFDQL